MTTIPFITKVEFVLLLTCLIASNPTKGQEAAGVLFEEGLSWQQVQAKAQTAHKLIFVDCFATWCGPCKDMDKKVYPDPEVGAYIKEHYISVKVQMDVTKQDSDFVKSWRADAQALEQQYKIKAYPTFLFFSPEGQALHKGVGSKSPETFLALAQDATNPAKQYFTQLQRYQSGKDYLMVPGLVEQANKLGETETAKALTLDYIDHYLGGLDESALLTKPNLEFLAESGVDGRDDPALGSSGRIFQVLYLVAQKPDDATSITKLARDWADGVIKNEEINSKLWSNWSGAKKHWIAAVEKPDWSALNTTIAQKYGAETAKRVILNGQITWYSFKKDYPNFAAFLMDKWDRYGAEANWNFVNQVTWDLVFEHSSDPVLLERAVAWQRKAVGDNPDTPEYLDTLANLLYKAGRGREGIAMEERAAALADAQAAEQSVKYKQKVTPNKVYRDTAEKMKQGLPTWSSS